MHVGRYLKHLRTGLNLRARDHSALIHLLVEKGVITDAEYKKAVVAEYEAEKAMYEALLTERFKRQPGAHPDLKITLG